MREDIRELGTAVIAEAVTAAHRRRRDRAMTPTPDLIDTEAARLELNARHYRYDATLLLTIERRPEAMT